MSRQQKNWFKRVSRGDSERAASRKSGVKLSTLNNQLKNESLSAETVILLCRAYNVPPLRGLAATGHLTPEEALEAGSVSEREAAQLMTDRQLVLELARRIDADVKPWDQPFSDVIARAR